MVTAVQYPTGIEWGARELACKGITVYVEDSRQAQPKALWLTSGWWISPRVRQ
jgi:hypothetical protein